MENLKENNKGIWPLLSFSSLFILIFGTAALINPTIAGALLTFIACIVWSPIGAPYFKKLWLETISVGAHITLFGIFLMLVLIIMFIFLKGWRLSCHLEKK